MKSQGGKRTDILIVWRFSRKPHRFLNKCPNTTLISILFLCPNPLYRWLSIIFFSGLVVCVSPGACWRPLFLGQGLYRHGDDGEPRRGPWVGIGAMRSNPSPCRYSRVFFTPPLPPPPRSKESLAWNCASNFPLLSKFSEALHKPQPSYSQGAPLRAKKTWVLKSSLVRIDKFFYRRCSFSFPFLLHRRYTKQTYNTLRFWKSSPRYEPALWSDFGRFNIKGPHRKKYRSVKRTQKNITKRINGK